MKEKNIILYRGFEKKKLSDCLKFGYIKFNVII